MRLVQSHSHVKALRAALDAIGARRAAPLLLLPLLAACALELRPVATLPDRGTAPFSDPALRDLVVTDYLLARQRQASRPY